MTALPDVGPRKSARRSNHIAIPLPRDFFNSLLGGSCRQRRAVDVPAVDSKPI